MSCTGSGTVTQAPNTTSDNCYVRLTGNGGTNGGAISLGRVGLLALQGVV